MRVLCCGDREWNDRRKIVRRLDQLSRDDVIVHGNCRGADRQCAAAAEDLGFKIEPYPADWVRYGKAAGPIRNQQMLESGIDLVLAFHGDIVKSKGTADMVRRAKKAGVTVEVVS